MSTDCLFINGLTTKLFPEVLSPHRHLAAAVRRDHIGRAFGDQEEAAWLPFTGISYDSHHNQLFVTVGGISSRYPVHLTHMMAGPQMLHVRRTPEGEVCSLLIVGEDKTEALVRLRRQPQLAA